MITQKMTLAACIGVLSATLLASNANAMNCTELTGNQFLAAVERGQCSIETANVVVEDDKWIRTSQSGGRQGSSGKSGGGYKY
jgi:hypothetical protein